MAPVRMLVLCASALLAGSNLAEAIAPVTVMPAMKCPASYALEGSGCIRRSVVPATATCRHKGELEGHECVETGKVEASLVCNEGLLRKGKKCIRHDVQEMMLKCPEGFQLVNGECVGQRMQPTIIECPKGFKRSGLNCIRNEKHKAEHGCPDGYRIRHDRCISQKSFPASEICSSENFRLQDGSCFSVELSPPALECPKGYKIYSDPNGGADRCTKYKAVDPQQVCDRGKFDGKKYCLVEEMAVANPNCPKGYTIEADGNCVSTDEEDPVVECSHAGWDALDGRCVHKTISKPSVVCPNGSVQARGKCERFDVVAVNRECHNGILRDGFCVSEIVEPPNVSCPKFYHAQDNMCIRRITHKASFTCPPGSQSKGRLCHSVEVVDPSCPGGNCQSVEVAPARMRCAKGFTMNTAGKCIREVIEDMVVVCPHGSTLNKKSMCEKHIPIPAILQCPPTFHPVSKMPGVVGPPNKPCVRVEKAPPVFKGM